MTTFLLTLLALAFIAACCTLAALRYALVVPLTDRPVRTNRPADDHQRSLRLEKHIRSVASQPHNTAHYEALEAAADYIADELTRLGHTPQTQSFFVDGNTPVRNIWISLPPAGPPASKSPATGAPVIVIGAHYDAPDDCPGANDNGTGVAALLEIARELAGYSPAGHRLDLVFFVNEEAPYCKTPDMGSWRYAQRLNREGSAVEGMMALETLGFFSSKRGTQKFPFPFNHIYDTRGDFVAFVGLPRARTFTHRATRAFRRTGAFPSIGGIAPAAIPGIDLSDHWSFEQFGFPALMVTDTAPFRNPFYHTLQDTPDTVDYTSLSAITGGLVEMIRDLAPADGLSPKTR